MQNDSGFVQWKKELLQQIDAEPDTVAKGDSFVQLVLRYRYQLSDDDAVNATDMAGGGDYGIDGLIVEPSEDANPPHGIIVQGKYGTAGLQVSPLDEFRKFSGGLDRTRNGEPLTDALEQCASVLQSGGALQYIVATVDLLTEAQLGALDDARAIANQRYGLSVSLEAICLQDLYDEIGGEETPESSVFLTCKGVSVESKTYVGVATLVDVYQMLRQYAQLHNASVDSIYDRNVRKWLGKRAKSVNDGISNTLLKSPKSFIAYNNGISVVCRNFESTSEGLRIDSPQIVNGCQTTRTLFDFMENRFAGVQAKLTVLPDAGPYREASLAFKLIAVDDFNSDFVRNITRFSNKQNAVRGRDFLTLEENFHRLKTALREQGYFLEVQTGEYNVLPKAERQRFAQDRLINAFDALRFYGASVLSKPHTAFGRSGEFTPGGSEFEEATKDLTQDDLLIPWLMARHAMERGYSIGSKKNATLSDYRNQTRYLYLYVVFRIASQVLNGSQQIDRSSRDVFYGQLAQLRDDYVANDEGNTAFGAILDIADDLVATYMGLAHQLHWFYDRNAFLKSQELLNEERIAQASGQLFLKAGELEEKVRAALAQ